MTPPPTDHCHKEHPSLLSQILVPPTAHKSQAPQKADGASRTLLGELFLNIWFGRGPPDSGGMGTG